jgi:hypothetical protein
MNIEHPTSNFEHPMRHPLAGAVRSALGVRSSMFDVSSFLLTTTALTHSKPA